MMQWSSQCWKKTQEAGRNPSDVEPVTRCDKRSHSPDQNSEPTMLAKHPQTSEVASTPKSSTSRQSGREVKLPNKYKDFVMEK